jgi:hypothetical protein
MIKIKIKDKIEAKKTSLEIWKYLKNHPYIKKKSHLPPKLYNKIYCMFCECPLCELYYKNNCDDCPLKEAGNACSNRGSLYEMWYYSCEFKKRKEAAKEIYNIIKKWDIYRKQSSKK